MNGQCECSRVMVCTPHAAKAREYARYIDQMEFIVRECARLEIEHHESITGQWGVVTPLSTMRTLKDEARLLVAALDAGKLPR